MAPLRDICSRYCLFDKLLLNSFITCKKIFFTLFGSKNKFQSKTTSGFTIFTILNLSPKVNHHTKNILSLSEQYSKFYTKDESAFVTK